MSWLSQTASAEPALDVASPVSRAVHGIWEADELFKCPLVGMGITLAEQIEVDAVHDQNAIHRMMSFGLCGLRAGLRCCRGAQHREKETGKPERNGLPVEKEPE